MLSALNFVKGAVAKDRTGIGELTHFIIENGFIKGSNGTITLCCPVNLNLSCAPKASSLIRAIGNCEGAGEDGVIRIRLTPSGKLSISSGAFKAFIECLPETFHHGYPEGSRLDVDAQKLSEGLKKLAPFLDKNATKAWSRGILFKDGCLSATDNIIVAQYWVGASPETPVCIPWDCVNELSRIKEEPEWVQVHERSITFHFSGRRWLKSAVLDNGWPDIGRILNVSSNPAPIDKNLMEYCKKLKLETDQYGSLFFGDDRVGTSDDPESGSSFDLPGVPNAALNVDRLMKVLQLAETMDLSSYPRPIMWFGENVRGAIAGMIRK